MKDPEKVIKAWYYKISKIQEKEIARMESTSNKARKFILKNCINEDGAVLVVLKKIYLEIYDKEI